MNFKTPPNFRDLTGQRFGRLVVIKRGPNFPHKSGYGTVAWVCTCDCGSERVVRTISLIHGKTVSCGCYKRESVRKRMTTHGHTTGHAPTRTHSSWTHAIKRCYCASHKCYANYGGRGIRMCDEWRTDFSAFLRDMGECPEGMTLDRIDCNGDYEPGNCRWADGFTQARNRRNGVLNEELVAAIRAKHESGSGYRQLAEEFGVSRNAVYHACTFRTWK